MMEERRCPECGREMLFKSLPQCPTCQDLHLAKAVCARAGADLYDLFAGHWGLDKEAAKTRVEKMLYGDADD